MRKKRREKMKSEIFFMCRTEDEKKHSRDFFDGVCYKKNGQASLKCRLEN